ncbi:efflux RND transporter permease subunit [Tundrisphaera lichenicola]|uniref:efflux RND transporter permease subunit n=1 Tax=Tundrisphaera lichenicola TaxID=2029860 RepID=UPI003EBA3F8E
MIENIIEWSIRNRFVVILVAIVVGVAGFRALMTMPLDAIPDQSENQVIVFTDWLGRSPQEIEDQVTYPLSVNLQGLAGVKVVRSSSEFNFSMINIIFDESIDYYFARERVLERLSIASTFLPPDVTPYMAPDATAVGQIFWYTVEGESQDLGELRAIQDWYVRYQLNSVPGVAEVASVGGAPREYQIDIDPNQLRAYGVSLGEINSAIARSNSSVGGRVIHKGNAEYLIRSVGWIKGVDDIRNTVVAERGGVPIYVKTVASVQMGPGFKRSVLEKDGREMVGGVVLMRYGENPLEVTRKVKEKIATLSAGLPEGVRIVPFYDRTPLINKALATISDTVKEEIIISTISILLIMGHLGGAFVVSLTLPMAILFSFLMMKLFGIPSNIMSLAGIAISVGILQDQAVVMTENAAHHLTKRFGKARITGNVLDTIIPACRTVGRPIFFSILITVLSFLPVFALTGRSGKMFHPLAWTKTFALIGVAILAITLVPALIPIFLRGRIKSEEESWLVRTMISIFKPMLSWLMDRTTLVCWLFAIILGCGYLASTRLGHEFMPPLDEGSILEMPTSVPRISVTQVTSDLKTRDAVLREFPEVLLVVGKAGRAETATDPSPLDMIETIINLQDRELWPKRKLRFEDALWEASAALGALQAGGMIRPDVKPEDREALLNESAMEVVTRVDVTLRELALRKLKEARPELGRGLIGEVVSQILERVEPRNLRRKPTGPEREDLIGMLSASYGDRLAIDPRPEDVRAAAEDASKRLVDLGVLEDRADLLAPRSRGWERASEAVGELIGSPKETFFTRLHASVVERHDSLMKARMKSTNWDLFDSAVPEAVEASVEQVLTLAASKKLGAKAASPDDLKAIRASLEGPLYDHLFLWKKEKQDLVDEMDTALQVPGWGNIFTQPIINRIEMLATGVRTPVAVKVFGDDLGKIQDASQRIAEVLRGIRGANGVVPDQVVGKGYIEIDINREKAARYGVQVGDIQEVVEVAMGGKPITMTVEGRERFPVRIRYARDFRGNEEDLKRLLVQGRSSPSGMDQPGPPGPPLQVPIAEVADVRVVEGPSMIKSENGLLRAYIQLTVAGRDEVGFVEEARRIVDERVKLPRGMYIEWAGQFENELKTRRTLAFVFPAVIAVIVMILYLTYRSWIDALLMMTSVLGALAGGAIFQWLFGFNFSVAVWVGYIACFGMATETGIVMLVYLREAVDERGGLANIRSVEQLREAILEGAIHRLRPKLLTEGTTILSIAPMLWATGVGAEVVRPMAAPVLGGLLIADEVIDVFLPVLYFTAQKWRWRKLHKLGPFEVRVRPEVTPEPALAP